MKISAMPTPAKIPPNAQAIRRSPSYCHIPDAETKSWTTLIQITVRIVLRVISRSSKNQEARRSGILNTRLIVPIGRENKWFNISAIPDTPPGATWLGSIKHQIPIACKKAPAKSNNASSPSSFHFFFLLITYLLPASGAQPSNAKLFLHDSPWLLQQSAALAQVYCFTVFFDRCTTRTTVPRYAP